MPDDLAVKCSGCGEILIKKEFEKNLKVCPKCGHHHRMTVNERIASLFDENSFEEIQVPIRSKDFMSFPDYQNKLEKSWSKLGEGDSFRIGRGEIQGRKCIAGLSEFSFMGGSMGSVAGEKIAIALELGAKEQTPVLLVTTSGGARMQEGLTSLMQMAKTSASVAQLAKARVPLIVLLTDPTTAGVMASYASLGDVLISEPGALIAFTGQRVAAQAAQGTKLPANYQTAEWRLEKGHIDTVVVRRDLPSTLGKLLGLLHNPEAAPVRKSLASSSQKHKATSSSEAVATKNQIANAE